MPGEAIDIDAIHRSGAISKPHDLVRTPSGRTARVLEVLGDGRRACEYLDGDRAVVELKPALLYIVKAAPVVPWRRDRDGRLAGVPVVLDPMGRLKP